MHEMKKSPSSKNIFYNDNIDSHDLIAIVIVVVLVVDWDDIKNVEENCGLGHYLLVGSSSWLQLEYEVVICDTSGVFSKKTTLIIVSKTIPMIKSKF